MGKLIYADDISTRLERVIRIGAKADDGEHPISAECVLSVLESLPPVNAVEVVRCKDCKWYGYYSCEMGGNNWMRDGNGFCDRGERKEGDYEKAD